MTTTTQPLPAPVRSANPMPPHDQHASRLLALWVELAQRAASAAAHANSDESALRRLQLQVEDALADRLPEHPQLLDELAAWEASLIHVAQAPPEACLACRKARLGLPADLPLPVAIGGSR